jgi:geranylgeranyl diphosphate synthase type I
MAAPEASPSPTCGAMSSEEEHRYARFARQVRQAVEAHLAANLERKCAEADRHGAEPRAMVDAYRALAVRGGKRVRAVLVCAAHEAFGGDYRAALPAAVGVELLQTYLLIHDDWMDGDEVRRGGPSVHAMLRERYGSTRLGDATAILAGDYGAALALEALAETALPAARVLAAVKELARIQGDVVVGQLLDVLGTARGAAEVEVMHALKTGSYTIAGPLRLGAILAGASQSALEALDRVAHPLGVAFQLQDDLLGTFGDPARTGKPRGGDLREGKRTALVAEIEDDRSARPLLDRVLGVADAPDEEVAALIGKLVSSGARARVEARATALLAEARAALEALPVPEEGRALLRGAVEALAGREH